MGLCRNEETPKKLDRLLTIRFEKEFGIAPGSFLLTGIWFFYCYSWKRHIWKIHCVCKSVCKRLLKHACRQHLRIKKFWGTSENAVRIQIYCAIITYCLVAIVQHDMKLERSIYEVLQILGISLTDKTCLRYLFDKSNFKSVNVLYDSREPNLFNF